MLSDGEIGIHPNYAFVWGNDTPDNGWADTRKSCSKVPENCRLLLFKTGGEIKAGKDPTPRYLAGFPILPNPKGDTTVYLI